MPLRTHSVDGSFSGTNSVCSRYDNATGVSEFFITIDSHAHHRFTDTLRSLHSVLRDTYRSLDLTPDSHVFSRFFFSDIRSQKRQLLASDAYDLLKHSACSFVQQPPLNGGDLSVLIYHVSAPNEAIRKHTEVSGDQSFTSILGNTYGLHFSCNMSCPEPFGSAYQTLRILEGYSESLFRHSLTIPRNTTRTWLFIDDIENHYQGLVDARTAFFARCGLTAETHFIASTGIEARLEDSKAVVSMDALSIQNIVPDQITHLSALDNLNPPHHYGVTFERGTKLQFGDRAHYHISGTASIDKYGHVIYQDDVQKQTQRVTENIRALLESGGSSMDDLAYLVVYLKDPAHYSDVTDVLDALVDPHIPRVYLEAKVCRPAWLVEIEGFGVRDSSADFPPFI